MSIDTRDKRGSIISMGLMLVLPLADADISQSDRQQIVSLYSGILAGVPVIPPAVTPPVDLDEFFDPDDGFVFDITLSSGVSLTGYFDIVDSEFYLDDDLTMVKAEFVTESITNPEMLVGDTVTIDSNLYRVNGVLPDGTGIMTLNLLRTTV